jgi:hypothetical protein
MAISEEATTELSGPEELMSKTPANKEAILGAPLQKLEESFTVRFYMPEGHTCRDLAYFDWQNPGLSPIPACDCIIL